MKYYNLTSKEVLEGKDLGNNCHVFNEHGNLSLATETEYVKLLFSSPHGYDISENLLYVIFQNPLEYANRKEAVFQTQLNKILLLQRGTFHVYIREKHSHRLPYPYISSCTDGNLVSNLLSDHYTYKSCQEECAFNYMLKQCNDVVDTWKKYLTTNATNFDNAKFANRKECLIKVIGDMLMKVDTICSCKKECKEIAFIVEKDTILEDKNTNHWILYFTNKGAVIEENYFPDFPTEQFLGTFGGVLGLSGKFQVVFQFLMFVFACITGLLARNR